VALSKRFQDALVFAAELHAEQVRKGTAIPYVSHLLAVASLALEHGASEDEAIAALLHDAIEDQGGAPTREELWRRFSGGRDGTLWYYRALVDAYRDGGSPVLGELERVVEEMERLASQPR
jgi:hypothetical protein